MRLATVLLLIAPWCAAQAPSTQPASQPTVPPVVVPAGKKVTASAPLIPTGTVQSRPAAGMEPAMVLLKREHDFGNLDAGQSSTAEVGFRNDGKGPLMILQMRPACACVLGGVIVNGAPYTLGSPIPPGASGSIRFSIRALWSVGDKHTKIDLLTNDPQFPPTAEAPFGQVQIKIEAHIQKVIEFLGGDGKDLVDNKLSFGSFTSDAPVEGKFTIRSARNQPFEILGIVPKDPHLDLRAEPLDPGAGAHVSLAWSVVATVPKGEPFGSFMKRFTLATKPEILGLSFYVEGQVRGLIDVDPPAQSGLRIGLLALGPKAPTKVTLKNTTSTPLAIRNIRIHETADYKLQDGSFRAVVAAPRTIDPRIGNFISTVVTDVEPGKTATIEVVVKPGAPRGFFNCMLVFETSVPGGPAEIALPVSGVLK